MNIERYMNLGERMSQIDERSQDVSELLKRIVFQAPIAADLNRNTTCL